MNNIINLMLFNFKKKFRYGNLGWQGEIGTGLEKLSPWIPRQTYVWRLTNRLGWSGWPVTLVSGSLSVKHTFCLI